MLKRNWTDREVSQVLERQMRNWEIARTQKGAPAPSSGQDVQQFVAVSRSVGLPGLKVSEALGERLGWPVFVKQVLQTMAGDDEYRKRLYEEMDGRDLSWLEEILRSLGLGKYGRDDYFHRLTSTILSLARKGSAVFLGRAVDLILPRDTGFRVRLIAPREYCIERYAEYKELPRDKAEREVVEIESERADFTKRHFLADPEDATRHDLVINMEQITESQTAEIIMGAMRTRGIVA